MSDLMTVAADPVARLVIEGGCADGTVLDVRGASCLIGSGAQCQLHAAGAAAELHCAVVARDGRFFVRNFALPDGTLLDGRRVLGELELRDQDRLRIGSLGLRVCIGLGEAQLPSDRPTLRATQLAPPPRTEESVDLGAVPAAPAPSVAPEEHKPVPRRTRVTQILRTPEQGNETPRRARPTLAIPRPEQAAPPPTAPVAGPERPRKTRSTLIMPKEELAAAAEAPTPQPRKTRSTLVMPKEELAAAAEPRTPPPQSRKTRSTLIMPKEELAAADEAASLPSQVDEASIANYLLASEAEPETPKIEEPVAAPAPGNLPAYSVASDAQGRPVLRIVVGRKDRAQPMLRKWEMEGARIASQTPLPRRYPSAVSTKLRALGVAALVVLALVGGFYLGRPGAFREKNPNPFVITVERWNTLSEDDKLDPLFRDALQKPVTVDDSLPAPPPPPPTDFKDPNI